MDRISLEFGEEIQRLLREEGIQEEEYADALGQVISRVSGHICNTFPWTLEGICYDYIHRNNVIDILFDLAEWVIKKYGEKNYNYCDMDCNLRANYQKIFDPCLKCSSLISKILKEKFDSCDRCNDTKIDPENYNEYVTICYEDHESTVFFMARRDCRCRYNIFIRELPLNSEKSVINDVYEKLRDDFPKDKHDSLYKLMRFGKIDSGFVLNASINEDGFHDIECTMKAAHHLSTIVDSFKEILEEE
jgi:hypothetical protein